MTVGDILRNILRGYLTILQGQITPFSYTARFCDE